MTADLSRLMGRIAQFANSTTGDGFAIRSEMIANLANIQSIADLPVAARRVLEAHRSEIMAGLEVPERRP